jgi:hypothetical protein
MALQNDTEELEKTFQELLEDRVRVGVQVQYGPRRGAQGRERRRVVRAIGSSVVAAT